ncbi:MAG: phage portal protein, partial [Armatimonadia bacterium]
MALNQRQAIAQTKLMLGWRQQEAERLDDLYAYLHGRQRHMWVSSSVPEEVKRMARMARVNVLGLVVSTLAQSCYVDGYRSPTAEQEAPAWTVWQKNRMDARQIGVHRAMFGYGAAYTTVMPGAPVAVITGHSPRNMTTVYGEDEDWPVWALEKRRTETVGNRQLYRLYDDQAIYYMSANDGGDVDYVETREHGLGKVPVVHFLNQVDLDEEVVSEIDPLMVLQDQIEFTTFGLLVVQHYGAFAQKWIAGWLAESEEQYLKATASKVWTFEDPDTKLGQFTPSPLADYIDSRADTFKVLAAIAQLPAHALRGELVNLSAEALAAAEQTERRKVMERQT